jgi:hypothetical protein
MHVWGWMAPVELEALTNLAYRMDSIVEVGCLHGRSAFALLTACRGLVYCVDPWNDKADHSYPSFMGSCGHFPNLRAVREYSSAEVADEIGDVDMVFIDGAHAYGAVLADIAAWLPHTRKVICGHDFQNADGGYPGVERAVQDVFGTDRVSVLDGTSIWAVDVEADKSVMPGLPSGDFTYTDEYDRTTTAHLIWKD